MGIPLGWNIVRDEAKEKGVLRADVTGVRSPIRRRARGGRPPRNHALSAFDTDALLAAHASRFPPVLEHAPRLSHARTQLPPAPPAPDRDEGAGNADNADNERPPPALTPGFAPAGLRPPRYADLVDVARMTADNGGRDGDREPRPDRARRVELDDAVDGAPPLVPGRLLTWTSTRRHAPYPRPARRSAADSNAYADDDEPPTTTSAVAHPPLRRVGHRRIADGPLPSSSLRESWSPVSALDGLGDRERSNSVSSTSSNLPWQTFLTTVVPDPVAPTAESSFASAAASASFTASSSRASSSNSNSARSSNTALTVPSRRPSPSAARRRGQVFGESFAHACESSDEGDSTASDTEDEASANPLSRRRMRPSYFADEPSSPRRYGSNVIDRGIDARSYVHSYYADATSHGILFELDGPRGAQVDGPAMDGPEHNHDHDHDHDHDHGRDHEPESFSTVDEDPIPSTSPASPLDQELRDARSLLERLSRRDDVGDDFWASVGLTRSFADGVERVQERGRF